MSEVPSRVVIVTGGSSGLGRAMTDALLAAGHRVVVVARKQEAIDAVAAAAPAERFLGIGADLTAPEASERVVTQTVERFGELHAVVNNAGLNLPSAPRDATRSFFQTAPDVWRAIVDTNVNAPFYLARAAIGHLRAARWGRIVNHVTSYRTMVRGGETPYGPCKAALEAATVAWSAELEGSGVTVNAILPGSAADTRMVSPAIVTDRSSLVPPVRFAGPITWLLSPASDGITGRRVVAAYWDPGAPLDVNVAKATSPAGWPETLAVAPARAWPPR